MCYGLMYGTVTAIGAIISSLTEPYHYHAKDNSIFGGLFISCGILGSVVAGFLLDKLRMYKKTIILMASMSLLLNGLNFYTMPLGNTYVLAANMAIFGFFAIPVTPVSFAFSVELSYPVPEAISNGMMILVAKVYASIMSFAAGILTTKHSPMWALWLFTLNNIIATVCSLFIAEDLRRLNRVGSAASKRSSANLIKTKKEEPLLE